MPGRERLGGRAKGRDGAKQNLKGAKTQAPTI
ncbi:hypothetical protein ACVWYF_004336 [Hymenobacter sp. UYAg731]